LKNEAEERLAEGKPALERAEQAIDKIKKEHITEMKSLPNPPIALVAVSKVIMIMLGEKISLHDPNDKIWKKG